MTQNRQSLAKESDSKVKSVHVFPVVNIRFYDWNMFIHALNNIVYNICFFFSAYNHMYIYMYIYIYIYIMWVIYMSSESSICHLYFIHTPQMLHLVHVFAMAMLFCTAQGGDWSSEAASHNWAAAGRLQGSCQKDDQRSCYLFSNFLIKMNMADGYMFFFETLTDLKGLHVSLWFRRHPITIQSCPRPPVHPIPKWEGRYWLLRTAHNCWKVKWYIK